MCIRDSAGGAPRPTAVVFLGRRWTDRERARLDAAADLVQFNRVPRVCVVGTFRVHFGDRRAIEAEAAALDRLRASGAAVTVLRPSFVVSRRSRADAVLRALAWCHPLVPRRFTGCCVDGRDLFAAIDRELAAPRRRPVTLLGPNRPWADVLRDHLGHGFGQRTAAAVATVLSWLFVGQLLGVLFTAAARIVPRLRCWSFDTLHPVSVRELLALYNPHNARHVKVVGYNTGVVHFGQRHPGKTVVSTTRCNRVARVRGNKATFDAGVTVRQATDVLSRAGKEFYVVPNYSFVTLGTTFFVPIHGSAGEVSTMADTIERVLLYDPAADRFRAAARGSPAFDQHVFNQAGAALLLRLTVRVKDKARYFLARETLAAPAGPALLAALRDPRPANVEIRKAKAASPTADVYRYYTQGGPGDGAALEFPRDRVGRVWDRIEANRVAAALFHAFMRRYGYHVELFFSAAEFAAFWDTHGRLPIAKIQLRYIKRDAYPHSPFREHDCVSADLFMLRKHKAAFERYVRATVPAARFNPGKPSV
jgi:hypothetical protein